METGLRYSKLVPSVQIKHTFLFCYSSVINNSVQISEKQLKESPINGQNGDKVHTIITIDRVDTGKGQSKL